MIPFACRYRPVSPVLISSLHYTLQFQICRPGILHEVERPGIAISAVVLPNGSLRPALRARQRAVGFCSISTSAHVCPVRRLPSALSHGGHK